MIDVIVFNPSPYALVFIHDKPLGLRPQLEFIMYHIKHERVYVSYKPLKRLFIPLYIFIWYSHKVNIRRPVISVLQCIFPPIIIAARDKAET